MTLTHKTTMLMAAAFSAFSGRSRSRGSRRCTPGLGPPGRGPPDEDPACGAGPDPACAAPARLSETGLYAGGRPAAIDARNRPYSPQYPLWSDGATKARWIYLPPGTAVDTRDVNEWRFPVGTRFWKEFTLRCSSRPIAIPTRSTASRSPRG